MHTVNPACNDSGHGDYRGHYVAKKDQEYSAAGEWLDDHSIYHYEAMRKTRRLGGHWEKEL